jgi:tRNA(Ile)-lysidine synthase
MTRLEKKLRASLRRFEVERRDEQAKVLVAVSGGTDSVALLDALARWRTGADLPAASRTLFVAHLNHSLRGEESDADEEFVRAAAEQLGLSALIERAAVAAAAQAGRRNLEATARSLRYEFLERAASECGARYVATAHTRDDQVETILLRLLRGSGAAGLRAIRPTFQLQSGASLIRPLLDVTRAEVLAHCAHYQLTFKHDSSNDSRDFTRNRVRHELLPLLRTFNPRAGEALIRAASRAAEDDDFLSALAGEFVAVAAHDDALELHLIADLHAALRRRVLRAWVEAARGDLRRIDAAHLLALDRLAAGGEGGSYVELPGGWRVRRERGRLRLSAGAPSGLPGDKKPPNA